jgi:predicted DCC family thiol-disulfide oxidoreductase YuxK
VSWGARWDRFWFAPSAPDALGLARLTFFSLLFLYYVRVDFSVWGDIDSAFWTPIFAFRILRIPALSVDVISIVQCVWKASLLLAAIGLFTRLGTITAFVGGFYLLGLNNNFGKVQHTETVLVFALAFLCVSYCGHAWSIDSVIRAARGGPRSAPSGEYTWPIRAVWTTFALIFFAAGVAKLQNSELEWIFSDNLSIMLVQAAYGISSLDPIGPLGLYLAQFGVLTRILAAATVLLETFYPLALFSRRARFIIVPGVAGMLLGIRVLMGPSFHQYLIAYTFWLPWALVPGRLAQRSPTRAMLFDGDCGLCQRTVRVIERLDVFHAIAYYDVRNDWRRTVARFPALTQPACLDEMHVVAADRVVTGFRAYRELVWKLPALWPLLPVLYVPGVPRLGQRLYRHVAARRLVAGCPIPHVAAAPLTERVEHVLGAAGSEPEGLVGARRHRSLR